MAITMYMKDDEKEVFNSLFNINIEFIVFLTAVDIYNSLGGHALVE